LAIRNIEITVLQVRKAADAATLTNGKALSWNRVLGGDACKNIGKPGQFIRQD
jgi:hypothetical protein